MLTGLAGAQECSSGDAACQLAPEASMCPSQPFWAGKLTPLGSLPTGAALPCLNVLRSWVHVQTQRPGAIDSSAGVYSATLIAPVDVPIACYFCKRTYVYNAEVE